MQEMKTYSNIFQNNDTNIVYSEKYSNNESETFTVESNVNDTFGLQFAASQWSKLVTHAEDLFNNLISSNQISEQDKKQICEWLFLKQECEDCISSEETISIGVTEPIRSLGRIDEETETDQDGEVSESLTSISSISETESETETDIDYSQLNLRDKLSDYIDLFKQQTDQLITENIENYFKNFTKSDCKHEKKSLSTQNLKTRRKSIHPGQEQILLENIKDLHLINEQKFSLEHIPTTKELKKFSNNLNCDEKIKVLSNNLDIKQNKVKKIKNEQENLQKNLDELVKTIQIKEQLIKDMIRNGDVRNYAKQKFERKRNKLEEQYYKTKTQLVQAEQFILNGRTDNKSNLEKLKNLANLYEKRLKDIEIIRHVAEDSAKKIIELENSLHSSRKQVDRLKKQQKKDDKLKLSLEKEINDDKKKLKELEQVQLSKKNDKNKSSDEFKKLVVVSKKFVGLDEKDILVHDIRNLRKTRDCLVNERCVFERKFQNKMLSDEDERRILECEEAIEVIDSIIEYKNELICNNNNKKKLAAIQLNKSVETNDNFSIDILIERLMRLSDNELREILTKYFKKIVDLRESSKKLDKQILDLERDNETNTWRVQALSHALQQVRLEGERRLVLLQRQHEEKLNLMLRHFVEETTTSASSSCTDFKTEHALAKAYETRHRSEKGNSFAIHRRDSSTEISSRASESVSTYAASKHIETTSYKQNGRHEERFISKYEENGHERNRLIAKFQEMTRYHSEKHHIEEMTTMNNISNLKQLQSASVQPSMKVTRQKNKLIIQQSKPKKSSKN